MKFRTLNANEIECRVGTCKSNGISLLLYKDARADMTLLDEVVGAENWQRKHELIDGKLFCSVGIYIENRNEWVWKQDVGTESKTEAEKGQSSDSFKRACVNWGIGRELYTAPFVWISRSDYSTFDGKDAPKDRFKVSEIEYKDKTITKLVIINDTTKKVVFTYGNAVKMPEDTDKKLTLSTTAEVDNAMLRARLKKYIISVKDPDGCEDYICKRYKLSQLSDIKDEQVADFITQMEAKGEKI